MLCLQSKKQAPCYSRLLGFKLIMQQLTRLSTGRLFSWRFADLYCTFTNKHCVSLPRHSQARGKNMQKQAHTFHATKSPQYVVERWIACSVLIRMSHQTVINENRMRVLIKGEKNADMSSAVKQKETFGSDLELQIALSRGGHSQMIQWKLISCNQQLPLISTDNKNNTCTNFCSKSHFLVQMFNLFSHRVVKITLFMVSISVKNDIW